jgi:hypothetical protein
MRTKIIAVLGALVALLAVCFGAATTASASGTTTASKDRVTKIVPAHHRFASVAAAPASGTQREPGVGEYDCNGISVVINHSWTPINGVAAHRTSAFWVGHAISGSAKTGDIDAVVQRDQIVGGGSVGGWQRDFHASHVDGWAQALSTSYTPFHTGQIWSAFDISTWSPVGDFHHRCSIQLDWPPR